VALAQLDAENHYRLRATLGRPEVGRALLDKLDRTLGRAGRRERKPQARVPPRYCKVVAENIAQPRVESHVAG
jgi:hypothetical protein